MSEKKNIKELDQDAIRFYRQEHKWAREEFVDSLKGKLNRILESTQSELAPKIIGTFIQIIDDTLEEYSDND